MSLRFSLAAVFALLVLGHAAAQEPDARKQLFSDLATMEKIARERLFSEAEWEAFGKLEVSADELIREAERKQAELDQNGKAELYRLFVRASRLNAAEKAKTITPDEITEKEKIAQEIERLAVPLLERRLRELQNKKEAGSELTIRETGVFDGLSRWDAARNGDPAPSVPDDLNAARMELPDLLSVEQIALMEEQGNVRRDLRLKGQLAEIYRLLTRRAEAQEGEIREEALRRLAAFKTKRKE